MQAPLLNGFTFDPFSLFDDGFRPSELGVCGCDVCQALVSAGRFEGVLGYTLIDSKPDPDL
jgi:hypothetical protein